MFHGQSTQYFMTNLIETGLAILQQLIQCQTCVVSRAPAGSRYHHSDDDNDYYSADGYRDECPWLLHFRLYGVPYRGVR